MGCVSSNVFLSNVSLGVSGATVEGTWVPKEKALCQGDARVLAIAGLQIFFGFHGCCDFIRFLAAIIRGGGRPVFTQRNNWAGMWQGISWLISKG